MVGWFLGFCAIFYKFKVSYSIAFFCFLNVEWNRGLETSFLLYTTYGTKIKAKTSQMLHRIQLHNRLVAKQ
jgi:hypothetical protein